MLLWEEYPRFRVSPAIPSDLRHADVTSHLESFHASCPQQVQLVPLGESVEGRSISMLQIGGGERRVLAWTQMHGDEPTHTAVLLDLINFLLQAPPHRSAETILAGCQLHLILMLNPDGAQRWTRRNAQDLDINRDARLVQSPEGQILRAVVEDLRPDFALNLHNHRARTTAGQSQHPASLALLVPPIDEAESETASVQRAKRLAGHLAQRVAPYCPGPVSRYDADFMPRCFGEWIQQQGSATITIEAGGWSTLQAEPLVQLHFYGLIACLESIATNSFLEVSPDLYEALPRTGAHDLFDHLLRDVTIVNGWEQAPFRGDVGINFTSPAATFQGATIADLGDLHVTSGKLLTTEADLIVTPGRFAWLPEVTPSLPLQQEAAMELLAAGVTTILGQVDLAQQQDVANLEGTVDRFSSPMNLCFLGKLTDWTPDHRDRLLLAMTRGMVGVLADELPLEAQPTLAWLSIPTIRSNALPTPGERAATVLQCASRTQECANLLGMPDRGSIGLAAAADLCLWRATPEFDETSLLTDIHLHRVIVGGNVVFEAGEATGLPAGRLLGGQIVGGPLARS